MGSKMGPEEVLGAHRHFAIECNNNAWSLVEASSVEAQRDELLDLAHASALHWRAIGTDLEKMRATMLLANVHAALGLSTSAMNYAQQMRTYFLGHAATPDWEIAFVHTIHARACACAGNEEGHADSYAKAQSAIAAIADPQDRAIVVVTFEQVPKPRLTS
tara:strand:- start:728 stop:1210 length:483 start_codon:yes stop_codon:yes gene_type:complete